MTRIEHGFPLARLTTIGVGGPARAFARPRSLPELVEALRFARDEGLAVLPVGLGSNLLASDDGVDALVLRLEGELAAVDIDGAVLRAGGGATNAVCLHRARDAGLGGLEFACAIPGTAGGGVRMNAGAYGRDWSDVLVRALVATADGEDWLSTHRLGFAYRHSELGPSDVVARVEYELDCPAAGRDQGDRRGAGGAAQGHAADEQAHVRQRLQESGLTSSARGGCSSCAASRATGSAAR